MAEFTISTRTLCEMTDITSKINELVPKDMLCGMCLIYCPHTTAGLTVNENADPDVRCDLLRKLEKLIPRKESYYLHAEGNSDAHLKSMIAGCSLTLPIRNGSLAAGTWQGVYLCEFDGPRTRKIQLTFLRGEK